MNKIGNELIYIFLIYILICIIMALISYCFLNDGKTEEERIIDEIRSRKRRD